ncbi:MAG TPA: cytochrome c peroxidase [Pirellulales bacterium]|nr:cytochrome c peroxidase [Pirellulales bacterium]
MKLPDGCHRFVAAALLAACSTACAQRAAPGEEIEPLLAPRLRRPVALALLDNDRWLFVANQRSGSVSVVDPALNKVAAEFAVGRRLSDLVALHDGRHLVAADEAAGQLILLRWRDDTLSEEGRLDVPAAPVSLELSADGKLLVVASLWAHRVALVEVSFGEEGAEGWRLAKVIEMPFAPGKMCFLERDSRLAVADAFGGRLGLVDVARGRLLSVRELPGHNFRGLTMTADGRWLLVAQQAISRLARADREDIHWGTLLRNNLRWLSPEYVAGEHADLLAASRLEFLGGTGNGAADPGEVVALSDGRIAIAVSGIDAVLLGRVGALGYQRVAVGRRPTALAAGSDGKRIYVANTLADSISVIDVSEGRAVAEISLGPQPELSLADRGELLFYAGRLSHDGWMSCHSCHPNGHTNNQLVDNLSDGSYGDPKRVLTLLGARDTGPWAWNGGISDIERQVRVSIASTMQGPEPTDEQVASLAAFVRSLEPPPRVESSAGGTVEAGHRLFDELDCRHCHAPPSFTSAGAFDVGTRDENGRREFNPPSLRGVGQRDRYFHDNRAESLADVFREHRHSLPRKLSEEESEALVHFLRSL